MDVIPNQRFVTCECGKNYNYSLRFSVYEKDFCSKPCLTKYKVIEDEKRQPKKSTTTFRSFDTGGRAVY